MTATTTTRPVRVYLAGPMRGIPDYNYPAFNKAAAALRKTGTYAVFNPAEDDTFESEGIRGAMAVDLNWILDEAEMIFVLPGWQISKGAVAEITLGLALDLPVYELINRRGLEEQGVVTLQRIHSVQYPFYRGALRRG